MASDYCLRAAKYIAEVAYGEDPKLAFDVGSRRVMRKIRSKRRNKIARLRRIYRGEYMQSVEYTMGLRHDPDGYIRYDYLPDDPDQKHMPILEAFFALREGGHIRAYNCCEHQHHISAK